MIYHTKEEDINPKHSILRLPYLKHSMHHRLTTLALRNRNIRFPLSDLIQKIIYITLVHKFIQQNDSGDSCLPRNQKLEPSLVASSCQAGGILICMSYFL